MHVFDSLNVLGYRRSGNSLLSEVIPDIAAVRPASGNKEHQLLIFFNLNSRHRQLRVRIKSVQHCFNLCNGFALFLCSCCTIDF